MNWETDLIFYQPEVK